MKTLWLVLLMGMLMTMGTLFGGGRAPEPEITRGMLFGQATAEGETLRSVTYVPADYDGKREWPMIVFLHGKGECGTDGLRHVGQGLGTAIIGNPSEWPFVVLMLQKPDFEKQWEAYDAAVMAAIDDAAKRYRIDASRVYLTGLSQGGAGTWAIGSRHPERFAAIAPICGYGDPAKVAALASMPVWAFHGESDKVVPVAQSIALVQAVRSAKSAADERVPLKFTPYPGVDHNSWDRAYRTEKLGAWFLEHSRKK
jgi:predicted peptidase